MRRVTAWVCTVLMGLGVVVAAGAPAASVPAPLETVLAAEQPVSVETVLGFADVTESTTFAREITWLASEGISRGWGSGPAREFRPLLAITREQMAAFLYRLEGSPDVDLPAVSPFRDVAPDATFYRAIVWMAQEGISRGWSVTGGVEFRPLLPITREQMAAFLYRIAEEPAFAVPVEPTFDDVGPGSTFFEEIEWLASTQVTTGWATATGADYRPLARTNRDVMAAFLYRFAAKVDPDVAPVDGVVVAPETAVLEDAHLDGATFDREAGRLVLPASSPLDPNPNDVLAAGITDATPEGLLVRVVSIETMPDGTRVLTVEQAALTDVIFTTGGEVTATGVASGSSLTVLDDEVTVMESATPVSHQLARANDGGEDVTLAQAHLSWSHGFSVREASPSHGWFAGSGTADWTHDITVSMGATMWMNIGWTGINGAGATFTTDTVNESTLAMTGVAEVAIEKDLVTWEQFWTFWIGPVPVVIEGRETITASLSLEGEVSIASVVESTTSKTAGFAYADGRFTPISQEHATEPVARWSLGGSLTVTSGVELAGELRLYGLVGFRLAFGPYASLTLAGALGDSGWTCDVERGLSGSLSLVAGIKALGFEVGPQFEAELIGGRVALGVSDLCVDGPPDPPGTGIDPDVDPLAIITASLPDALERSPYRVQLFADGGDGAYQWFARGLPVGLELSEGGVLAGEPSEVGEFAVVVEVRSGDLQWKQATFTLMVNEDPVVLVRSVLTGAEPGMPFTYQLEVRGGRAPYAWEAVELPEGFTLSPEAVLSGTWDQVADLPVRVAVTDADGDRAELDATIRVRLPEPRIRMVTPMAQLTDDIPIGSLSRINASANGRYVVFHSTVENLLETQAGRVENIFIRDTLADTTRLVTAAAPDADLYIGFDPTVSDDGTVATFFADARNWFPGAGDGGYRDPERGFDWYDEDLVARDMVTGEFENLSANVDGMVANGPSESASMDASGRYVAFLSHATDLVSGIEDTNNNYDVFLRDRVLHTTTQVSVTPDGAHATLYGAPWAQVSADGTTVAFFGYNGDVVEGLSIDAWGFFLYDIATGVTRHVPVTAPGISGVEPEYPFRISDDAGRIAFAAEYVDAEGLTHSQAVFVTDVATGETRLVAEGTTADYFATERTGAVAAWDISGDGTTVATVELALSPTASNSRQGDHDLVLTDLDTSERTVLYRIEGSPDGGDLRREVRLGADASRVFFTQPMHVTERRSYGYVYEWAAAGTY